MNATRTAQLSLLVSVITLAVVLAIAVRPAPEPVDNTPSLESAIDDVQTEIAELRTLVERGTGPNVGGDILIRLDRLEASVASVGAKVQAICTAIQSSPFAPSGFACP